MKKIWNYFNLYFRKTQNTITQETTNPSKIKPISKLKRVPLNLDNLPVVLILTPVKDATKFLPNYLEKLFTLTYPHDKISLGFLESDSSDDTFDLLKRSLSVLEQEFKNVHIYQKNFGFYLTTPRWDSSVQYKRRSIMAKSRNFLCHKALQDEDWVLWIDVDVEYYPPDIIQLLLESGKEIVVPNCVFEPGGKTFDLNTFQFKPNAKSLDWSPYMVDNILQPPKGKGRLYLEDLREHEIVEVDGVGGTMLLIKADIHREGLIFPPFSYKHYIETEGLAMMAKDMKYTCWGLPQLEIIHGSH
ncbi:hypothetical protein [Crocosphaera sp. Alani8]|uniref:hypothetical protein n=1 Tax=Crocosphaera sp. Alani8 TaxID=3038952 RepID=UPI00313D9FA3